jgi:hypothetical protein
MVRVARTRTAWTVERMGKVRGGRAGFVPTRKTSDLAAGMLEKLTATPGCELT